MIHRLKTLPGGVHMVQFHFRQIAIFLALFAIIAPSAECADEPQKTNTLHPSQREQAQIEKWLKIRDDGWNALLTSNTVDAHRMATQIIDLAEEEFDTTLDQVDALYSLGTTYWDQNRHTSTEAVLLVTLALQEAQYSSDDPRISETLTSLEDVYYRQIRLAQRQLRAAQAVSATEKRAVIGQKRFGPNHPEVAAILLEGGKACAYDGRDGHNGAPLLERALKLYEDAYGPDHHCVSETLKVLVYAYDISRQYDKGQIIQSRITDRVERNKGSDHPEFIEALQNLARAYQRNKHFSLAEQTRLRLIRILEEEHGT